MAGFCLEVRGRETGQPGVPLRPVDVGASPCKHGVSWGAVRLSMSYRGDSRQWWTRERNGCLALIEGHPDRYPAGNESLEDWLGGERWGSYRGLEVRQDAQSSGPPELLIFVDPLGTRPLYFHCTAERLLVSDKLSTIALYGADAGPATTGSAATGASIAVTAANAAATSTATLDINWPALLEAMALGSVYSHDTTLHDVEELAPGEAIRFRGVDLLRRTRSKLPIDGDLAPGRVRSDPAGTLLAAMEKAVAETWADPGVWLLLSGGLDSRFVLALAGPGRKAVTLQLFGAETDIARQVAACCRAELRVIPHRRADFLRSTQLGVTLGGAMHDPHFFNHLGLGAQWRSEGVAAVTHAYLFDTLLKGYFLLPAGGLQQSALGAMMPSAACFFEQASGRASSFAAADVIGLLTAQGREALRARLAALDASLPADTSDGLDLRFENRVLERISRQIHYGTLLGWCEELDVVSPVFHPALWTWRRHSRARDRRYGRAFVKALLSLDHGILKVADANTGAPPRLPSASWRDAIRSNSLYQRFLRPFRRSLAGAAEDVTIPSGLGERFREPDALTFLTESIAGIRGMEWFDEAAIDGYLAKHRNGQDRYLEPLLACASAGRWQQIVRGRQMDL